MALLRSHIAIALSDNIVTDDSEGSATGLAFDWKGEVVPLRALDENEEAVRKHGSCIM